MVVAILGILAAIAIPRLLGLQDGANQKAIIANLKMIDNAQQVYAAENNVAIKDVGKDELNDDDKAVGEPLVPSWPNAADDENIVYNFEDGKIQAVVTEAIPGVPAGTYTLENVLGENAFAGD